MRDDRAFVLHIRDALREVREFVEGCCSGGSPARGAPGPRAVMTRCGAQGVDQGGANGPDGCGGRGRQSSTPSSIGLTTRTPS